MRTTESLTAGYEAVSVVVKIPEKPHIRIHFH